MEEIKTEQEIVEKTEQTEKKPYVSPELTKIGSVANLTKGGGGYTFDALSGDNDFPAD